jgi:hypothetical protein
MPTKKFGAGVDMSLAREMQDAGLDTLTQIVKAFQRGDRVRIAQLREGLADHKKKMKKQAVFADLCVELGVARKSEVLAAFLNNDTAKIEQWETAVKK